MEYKDLIRKKIGRIADRLLTVLFSICILIIVFISFQVTTFTTFHIPSDSMYPALQAGDNVLVNKWIMGARIFNIWDALEDKEVKIHRLPGVGKIKRNDVLVFNFPYPAKKDSLAMDVMLYYVKRCIALPGDTLEIRNGFYRIRGTGEELGNMAAQRRISALTENDSRGVVMESFPWSKRLGWTIKEFGPLPVPAKGQVVSLDSISILFYQHIIRYEQKKELSLRDKLIYLGDSLIREYRFKENYYFVSGDNMENSRDSRYWGLLPESYIVGKATRIWKSKDPADGHIRWDRVFKKIECRLGDGRLTTFRW